MNKFALVTGISPGIGRSIALNLARDGYHLILCYRNHPKAAVAVACEISKIGQKAYLVGGDISKSKQLVSMFARIRKITSRLDLLVNNAGFDYGFLL
jgi:3-oxoacyl-[acyl-carrier protein] reductase